MLWEDKTASFWGMCVRMCVCVMTPDLIGQYLVLMRGSVWRALSDLSVSSNIFHPACCCSPAKLPARSALRRRHLLPTWNSWDSSDLEVLGCHPNLPRWRTGTGLGLQSRVTVNYQTDTMLRLVSSSCVTLTCQQGQSQQNHFFSTGIFHVGKQKRDIFSQTAEIWLRHCLDYSLCVLAPAEPEP